MFESVLNFQLLIRRKRSVSPFSLADQDPSDVPDSARNRAISTYNLNNPLRENSGRLVSLKLMSRLSIKFSQKPCAKYSCQEFLNNQFMFTGQVQLFQLFKTTKLYDRKQVIMRNYMSRICLICKIMHSADWNFLFEENAKVQNVSHFLPFSNEKIYDDARHGAFSIADLAYTEWPRMGYKTVIQCEDFSIL